MYIGKAMEAVIFAKECEVLCAKLHELALRRLWQVQRYTSAWTVYRMLCVS